MAGAVWPAQVRGRRAPINSGWHTPGRPSHHGWDVLVPQGTPIQAVLPGRVRIAGEKGGAGCMVLVDHSGESVYDELGELVNLDGLSTLYMHLRGLAVDVGEFVDAGDVLGESGETGSARGPHLHFSVLVTNAWLERHVIELELLDEDEWAPAKKWPGFWVDPELLLPVDEPDELAGLGWLEAAKPKGRKVGVFGGEPPPPYKIRRWCVWQGEQRAFELLAGAGAVGLLWWLASQK